MTKAIGIRLEKYVFSEAVIVVVVLVRLLAIASRARVLYVCLCRCLYGSFTARAAILAELLYIVQATKTTKAATADAGEQAARSKVHPWRK